MFNMTTSKRLKIWVIVLFTVLLYQVVLLGTGWVIFTPPGFIHDGLFVFAFLCLYMSIIVETISYNRSIEFEKMRYRLMSGGADDESEQDIEDKAVRYNKINQIIFKILTATFSLTGACLAWAEIITHIRILYDRILTLWGISAVITLLSMVCILMMYFVLKGRFLLWYGKPAEKRLRYVLASEVIQNFLISTLIFQMISVS